MKKVLFLLLICGCTASPTTQRGDRVSDTATGDTCFIATDSLRLVFAGDVMGHGMQIKGAFRDGGDSCYNYFPVFSRVKAYVSSADIAVANLEVTLAGEPYEGYPRFSSHTSLAVALRDAGFDILVTANNHSMDRGEEGSDKTLNELDTLGLLHTGTFRDSVDRKNNHPLFVEKNGFKLCFLNYTYDTNRKTLAGSGLVNCIDTVKMAEDIVEARKPGVDYIVVYVHWGNEYENKENAEQRNIARFLARSGCNLIIGAHPHVVQSFETLAGCNGNSVPVIYSMGNFISNQRDRYRDGGMMFEVNLTKTADTVKLQSCNYEPVWVHRFPLRGVSVFRLVPVNDYLLRPEEYNIGEEDKKLMMQFYDDTKTLLPDLSFGAIGN